MFRFGKEAGATFFNSNVSASLSYPETKGAEMQTWPGGAQLQLHSTKLEVTKGSKRGVGNKRAVYVADVGFESLFELRKLEADNSCTAAWRPQPGCLSVCCLPSSSELPTLHM